mmetsp:Transcript_26744/g.52193  ORF Transcript_26744/g.52193 Transcript_26744/m.52193 type:complete len:840 (-) Transcript_26744:260-2779(-)
MNIGVVRNGFVADETLTELQRIEKYSFHTIAITRLAYVRRISDCAGKVGLDAIVKKLVPLLDKILRDTEKDVRSALAEQLGSLAEIISPENSSSADKKKDEPNDHKEQALLEMTNTIKETPESAIKLKLSIQMPTNKGGLYIKLSQQKNILHETEIIWEETSPTWKEFKIAFQDIEMKHPMKLVCWAKEEKGQKTSDFLGMCMIEISDLFQLQSDSSLPLCNRFNVPMKDMMLFFREIEITPKRLSAVSNDVNLPPIKSATKKKEHKAITHKLIPCIQKLLIDEDQEVREKACEALVKVAGVLDEVEVQTNILTVVLLLAHDENEKHKIIASKLLSSLAKILGPLLCSNFCAPELLHLADDPKVNVRKAAVQSFGQIARVAGYEVSKKKLLPSFRALAKDQVWSVRKSVVEQLVEMAAASDTKETSQMFGAMFEAFANDASRWVRNSAFEVLGRLIHTLGDHASKSLISWYCKIPALASNKIDQECTFFCAYNFPAVCKTVGFARTPELISTFQQLTTDTRYPVRRALAFSLHELAHIIGPRMTEKYLVAPFNKYLKDGTNEVRQGVIQGMGYFLASLAPAKRESYTQEIWTIVRNSQRSWRFRELIAKQLPIFSQIFSHKSTKDSILKLLSYLFRDEVAVVRKVAAMAMPHFLNRLYKDDAESCAPLLAELKRFAESKTYKDRQLFVFMCEAIITTPSTTPLFEESILPLLLKIPSDPITNVKISFCKHIVPRLRQGTSLVAPESLKKIVAEMEGEKESDIARFVNHVHAADLKRSDDIIQSNLEMLSDLVTRAKEQKEREMQAELDQKAPPAPKSAPAPPPKSEAKVILENAVPFFA